jgi:glucan phosphoethanolaminetransferase (alkaline phosphatase superfamily)
MLESYVPEAIGAAFLVTSIHFSGIVPGRHVSLLTFQVTSIIFVLIFSTLFSVIPRKSTLFRIYRLSVISTTLAILVFYVLFPVFTYTLHLRKQHSDKLSLNEVSKTETNNPGEKHYNFILIVIDTLRSDELGNPHDTPSIHKLAGSSLVFKNAHSLSPWTVPSVTSILTSAPPVPVSLLRHGIDPDFFRTIYSSGKWKEA